MVESVTPASRPLMIDLSPAPGAAVRKLLMAGVAWLAVAAASGAAQAQQSLATIPEVPAKPAAADDGLGDQGYYLESDLLIRDDAAKTMTARGSVEVRYQGRTLRAQEVIYDTSTGVVTAHGKVSLINADGTAQFADDLTLDKDMRAGFARNFSTRLEQNVKIAAATAIRRNEQVTELNQAIYTPCDVCAEKPTPTWSIEADKVVQDKTRQIVYYHGAKIRLWGAPLIYLPLFWHPDPQAPRSSGFLTPKVGLSQRRGLSYQQPYLQVLSPSQDVILSPQINTKVNPFLNVDYRKRFYSGMLEARMGVTYEKEFDNRGNRFGDATTRSYILAKGAFDIDEHWKWGFSAERASDALIFDKYDINNVYEQRGLFTSEDRRLTSQIYTSRQDDRSWLSISAVSVQGLRVVGTDPTTGLGNKFENSGAFPVIGPLVEGRWEPESPVLFGRLRVQGSGVMLNRSESQFGESPYLFSSYSHESGVDSVRGTVQADWRASAVVGPGLRIQPFAQARGDAYKIKGVYLSTAALAAGDDAEVNYSRTMGVAGVDLSLPLYKGLKKGGSVILEPLVQIATGSDSSRVPVVVARDGTTTYLYNEDSSAFEFDETNLFRTNKSPGFDLYEGGTRMNVGGRATFNTADGRGGSVLVGRSFRTEYDPLLPSRTGLQDKSSDWIVAATVTPVAGINAYVRTRLDSDTTKINRLETGVDANNQRVQGSLRYLKDNVDSNGERQENFEARGQLNLTKKWSLTAFGQLDLVAETWRRRDLGVAYTDDCIRIDIIYQQEDRYSSTVSGLRLQPDRSVVVRLTLATLGDTGYSD
ncbi:organic solvent tolerance protein [Caulobacter vibrioides]|nr:organic solvent tolerance protein [Caulobacter vibrioides]